MDLFMVVQIDNQDRSGKLGQWFVSMVCQSAGISIFGPGNHWWNFMKILALQVFSILHSVPLAIGNRFFNFIYRFRRKIILSYRCHRSWLLIMSFLKTNMVSNDYELFAFHPESKPVAQKLYPGTTFF